MGEFDYLLNKSSLVYVWVPNDIQMKTLLSSLK